MDKAKFNLSKANIVFWSITALFVCLRFFAAPEKSAYQIGELFGQLTAFLIIPMIVAWVVWLIANRSQRAGSITFNVVLALAIFGQLAEHGQEVQKRQTIQSFENSKEAYKQEIRENEDPQAISSAFKEYTTSVQSGLNDLAESSSGSEQAFYTIMADFTKESQSMATAWQDAFGVVQSGRILDFSRLHTPEEYKYQIGAVKTYIKHTEAYRDFCDTMLDNLRSRLSVLGKNNQYATGAIKGASKQYAAQKPIMDPLFEHHVNYGKQMIQLLQFLEERQSNWSYENGELLFDSDSLIEQYDRILMPLIEEEDGINTLTEKLLEVV